MTINFQRSELVNLLGVLSPYTAGFSSLGIRIKDEMLEMFAYTDNGSALARMACKGVEDREWLYVDGPALQELIKLADEGVIEINFAEAGLTLKFPCSMSELRSARIGIPPEGVKLGKSSSSIKGKDLSLLSTMTEAASTDETRPNFFVFLHMFRMLHDNPRQARTSGRVLCIDFGAQKCDCSL